MKVWYMKNGEKETVECEDLQIRDHSADSCSVVFLGKETGKNDIGEMVREITKVVHGIDEYGFK